MATKSFTTNKSPIDFEIDDEVFYLKSSVPAGRMTELSRLQGEMQAASEDPAGDAIASLLAALAEIFEPESFERFKKRFYGEYAPLDLKTFYEVVTWIFGEALGKGITLPSST